jgi:hypothetical protein
MSTFARIRADFNATWTTTLVGWIGLGILSPWPDRWETFPPLISASDLDDYANDRLALSGSASEKDLIVELLSLDLRTESRHVVKEALKRLSDLDRSDSSIEIRKWRQALLEELLDDISQDPFDGLMSLGEFWQSFNFPPDSPHEFQDNGNQDTHLKYYGESNFQRLLRKHRTWLQKEKVQLKKYERHD